VADDGTKVEAKQKIGGGPSVLYDAVVLLPSADGAAFLATQAQAKAFVADAFAHCKFIGYTASAAPLLDAADVDLDEGCCVLDSDADVSTFLAACDELRFWARELVVMTV
jgi:catalase